MKKPKTKRDATVYMIAGSAAVPPETLARSLALTLSKPFLFSASEPSGSDSASAIKSRRPIILTHTDPTEPQSPILAEAAAAGYQIKRFETAGAAAAQKYKNPWDRLKTPRPAPIREANTPETVTPQSFAALAASDPAPKETPKTPTLEETPKTEAAPPAAAPGPLPPAPSDPAPEETPTETIVGLILTGHQIHEITTAARTLFPHDDPKALVAGALDHFARLTEEPRDSVLGFVAAACRETYRRALSIGDTQNALASLKLLTQTSKEIEKLRQNPAGSAPLPAPEFPSLEKKKPKTPGAEILEILATPPK